MTCRRGGKTEVSSIIVTLGPRRKRKSRTTRMVDRQVAKYAAKPEPVKVSWIEDRGGS